MRMSSHEFKKMIRIKDKDFVPYLTAAEVASTVEGLARRIDADYGQDGKELVVCPVLTGAYMFAADLLRMMRTRCTVSFVRYTSYSGMQSTGEVRCALPFPESVRGKDVLIVEDVIDSGLSMGHIIGEAKAKGARSVRVCTFLFKPGCFKGGYTIDYIGREIGDEFIVGYGMDYDEEGRTLGEVYVVKV